MDDDEEEFGVAYGHVLPTAVGSIGPQSQPQWKLWAQFG